VTEQRTAGCATSADLRVCWASDIGRIRENNEDACLALPEQGLLAVSDGMGGESAGEVASSLAMEWLPQLLAEHLEHLREPSVKEIEDGLTEVLAAMNHRMKERSRELGPHRKMGATIALVLARGPLAHIAHVGDSRAYLLRDGALEPLTEDHSLVGLLVSRKLISREDAKQHPMRGQLLRYVGMGGNPKPGLRAIKMKLGDRLMLCTDGLTESMPDEEIERLMAGAEGIETVCQALVGTARATDGRDNITVVLAEKTSQ